MCADGIDMNGGNALASDQAMQTDERFQGLDRTDEEERDHAQEVNGQGFAHAPSPGHSSDDAKSEGTASAKRKREPITWTGPKVLNLPDVHCSWRLQALALPSPWLILITTSSLYHREERSSQGLEGSN